MRDESRYRPIACGLHDRLEAAATVGRRVRIVFRTAEGEGRECEERVVDVFARDGQEFLETGNGEVIRLDRLDSVDGVPFR